MRFLALIFVFISFETFAQLKVYQEKTPSWVTQYDYTDNISDTTQTSDGYAYLLISRQNHLELKESYAKYVMKVTSAEGLSIVSSINEYFDPSFHKLVFHELNVIRGGKKINKLDPSKFEVIRREEEMERAIYDKSANAIYNLADVRVGDIVEYAYTRKGSNPVFNGHSFGALYMQYGVPVGKVAHRLVYNSQRPLQFKSFGNIGTTANETPGTLTSSEWIREAVPALLTDDQLPDWFDAFPHVQYSDFKSWNQVKQWAFAIYNFPTLKNSDLKTVIESIRQSGKSDEDKIKECIRIAQGDIRYLSFSDGINGYKPHDPEQVYSQRYGDCKDKSFMLSLMLTNLGYNSRPALVSTDNGFTLPEILPNPYAFNHCIVQFVHKDSTYWIDPTLNAQVGPLKSYFFPTYNHALVINDDNSELTPIPFGYKKNSGVDIKEEYSMQEVGGFVDLKVTTTYYGDEADEMRSYYNSHTIAEINKSYLNFYAKDYSEISLASDFLYKDDSLNNVITTSEAYLVKNFWQIKDKNKSADIFASTLAGYLKKPQTRVRTMPLAVTHPRNIKQTIKIKLPEEWNIEDSNTEIESDAFVYKRSRFYADKVFTMRYEYVTKAAYVDGDRAADYIKKVDEVLDDTGYTIYKPLAAANGTGSANTWFIVTVLVIVGLAVARKKFRG